MSLYADEEDIVEYGKKKRSMLPEEEGMYTKRYYPCDRCEGSGKVVTSAPTMGEDQTLHRITRRSEECPRCNGTGKLFDQHATYGQ